MEENIGCIAMAISSKPNATNEMNVAPSTKLSNSVSALGAAWGGKAIFTLGKPVCSVRRMKNSDLHENHFTARVAIGVARGRTLGP